MSELGQRPPDPPPPPEPAGPDDGAPDDGARLADAAGDRRGEQFEHDPLREAFVDCSPEEWAHMDDLAPRGPGGERASDEAEARQHPPEFPAVDQWRDEMVGDPSTAQTGDTDSRDYVSMVPDKDGKYSGFGVMEGNLNDVGDDGEAFRRGVQMHKDVKQLDCYRFTQPCEIAVAPTEANPTADGDGGGGIDQAFVPHVQQRIDDGTLEYVGTHYFDKPAGSVS
jgi:hypothetical protein